jgi:hypothetical protein
MGACGIRGWYANNHPFDQLVTKIAKQVGFYSFDKGHAFVVHNDFTAPKRPGLQLNDNWHLTRIMTEGVFG